MQEAFPRSGEAVVAAESGNSGNDSNVALIVTSTTVVLVGNKETQQMALRDVSEVSSDGLTGVDGATLPFRAFYGFRQIRIMNAVAAAAGVAGLPEPSAIDRPAAVDPRHVSTLHSLPGHTTTEVLGVVTELSATSGLTATIKGGSALQNAMELLRQTAGIMGANAILGLSGSTFGAGGGITSAFGGDAVGVLLLGTAAKVVARSVDDETGHAQS
jgi:hypothetical protein